MYKNGNSLLAIFDKIYPGTIVQGVLSNFGAILKIQHQDAKHFAKNLWETLVCMTYVATNCQEK